MSTVKKDIDYKNIINNILPEIYELTKLGYLDGAKTITYDEWFIDKFNVDSYKENWQQIVSLVNGEYYYRDISWLGELSHLWFYLHYDCRFHFLECEYEISIQQREDSFHLVKHLIKYTDKITNPHFLYCLAIFFFLRKNYSDSLKYFKLGEKHFDGKIPPAFYCDWGKALYESKKFIAGDNKYKAATELSPSKWWIYDCWAESLFKYYRFKKLKEIEEKALKLNPPDKQFYENTSFRIISSSQDYQDYLFEIAPYLAKNKIQIADHYMRVGKRLLDNRDFYKAIEILNESLINDDNNSEVYSFLAQCYYYTMKDENSLEHFNKSHELDNKNDIKMLDKVHFKIWKNLLKRMGNETKLNEYSEHDSAREIDSSLSKHFNYHNWAKNLVKQNDPLQAKRVLIKYLHEIKKGSYDHYKETTTAIQENSKGLSDAEVDLDIEDFLNNKPLKPEYLEKEQDILDNERYNKELKEGKLDLHVDEYPDCPPVDLEYSENDEVIKKEIKLKKEKERFKEVLLQSILADMVNDSKIDFPALVNFFKIKKSVESNKITSSKNTKNKTLKKKTLILLPAHKVFKIHENELNWFDSVGKEYKKENIGNDPFDFLYYLSWLGKDGESKGMKVGSSMPKEDKGAILDNFLNRNRFMFKWTGEEGKESQIAQMARKKSIINNYFKFELILKKGIYYRINPEIIVELESYPTE